MFSFPIPISRFSETLSPFLISRSFRVPLVLPLRATQPFPFLFPDSLFPFPFSHSRFPVMPSSRCFPFRSRFPVSPKPFPRSSFHVPFAFPLFYPYGQHSHFRFCFPTPFSHSRFPIPAFPSCLVPDVFLSDPDFPFLRNPFPVPHFTFLSRSPCFTLTGNTAISVSVSRHPFPIPVFPFPLSRHA